MGGQYVDLYDFADGRLEVRWKGQVLPYRVFDKDQRVSHTAIVENKRLGHALAFIKAQQDLKYAPKVMTNSEKTVYKKRGRKICGSEELSALVRAAGNAGLMESMEDRTIRPSCLPPFPQTLEIAKERRFHTFPPRDCYWK